MKTNASTFKWNQQRFLNVLALVFLLAAILISIKNYYNPLIYGLKNTPFGVKAYNNFVIFKNSFFHLLEQKQLFHPYRPAQYDVFKYSPTFALFFGLFAWGGDLIGLILWNSLNLLLPLFALQKLWNYNSKINRWGFLILMLALLVESTTSALNSQSNGLMLGLMILTLVAIQKSKYNQAVLFIALTAFIKIFGLVLFALFLVKPGLVRVRQLFFSTLIIFAFLFFIPLVVVNLDYLLSQYAEWLQLLQKDGSVFVKYSVMGWIISWFQYLPNKTIVLLLGLILQMLPAIAFLYRSKKKAKLFANSKASISNQPFSQINNNQVNSTSMHNWGSVFKPSFPVGFLEIWTFSWIVWVVIFNHMAESATFIIAVGGIVGYLRLVENWNRWTYFLLILLFAFTILGPTDIYPREWRFWIVDTAQLKVFPVILFWGTMILHLFQCQWKNNAREE
jgi:hypothetical protein